MGLVKRGDTPSISSVACPAIWPSCWVNQKSMPYFEQARGALLCRRTYLLVQTFIVRLS